MGKKLELALLSCVVFLSACGGGGGDGGGFFCPTNNPAPKIDGAPPVQATVGQQYRFFADAEYSCLGGFPLPIVPGLCGAIEGVRLPPGAQAVGGSVVWTPATSDANTNVPFMIQTPPDLCGGRANRSWVVTVHPAPTIESFTASKSSVNPGESVTLTAVFQGAGGIDGIGTVASGASVTSAPLSADTTFTLRVSNGAGVVVTQRVFVHVIGPPTIQSFTASPTTIGLGSNATLSWTTGGDIASARLDPPGIDVTGRSSVVVTPSATTTYVLHLSNSAASTSASVQVEVLPPARIDSFDAAPTSTSLRGTVQLTATFQGRGRIAKQGEDGLFRVLGPISSGVSIDSGELLRSTIFELQVEDASGVLTTRRLEVTVTGPGTFRPTTGQPVLSAFGSYRATRLADGKVLISGRGTTQIFEPVTETFVPGPNILDRAEHSATLMGDGRVLIAHEFGANPARLQIYDPATNAVTDVAHTTNVRPNPAVALSDGRVVLAAANTAGAAIFDPTTQQFGPVFPAVSQTVPFLVGERLADGRVLFVAWTNQRQVQVFSPSTGSFVLSTAPFVYRARSFTITALNDGRVVLDGGFVAQTQAAELYHPANDSLTFAGSQNSPNILDQASVRLANGTVLFTGGHGADVASTYNYYYNSARIFDPATGVFTATGGMRTGRYSHTATLLQDGRVLVVGGCNGLPCEAEIYTP